MSPLEKNIMKPRKKFSERGPKDSFEEKVIEVSRVSRTVKGGRRIRFRALIVVGDKNGKVGMGLGKSNEVSQAVAKAASQARKNLITVPIINGTIPHEVIGQYGAAKVLLKPSSSGTSIVAGGSVRVVAELSGISDLLAKSLGSRNKINNIAATISALSSFNERTVKELEKYNKKSEISSLEKVDEPAKDKTDTEKYTKKDDKSNKNVKTK